MIQAYTAHVALYWRRNIKTVVIPNCSTFKSIGAVRIWALCIHIYIHIYKRLGIPMDLLYIFSAFSKLIVVYQYPE